MPSSFASLTRPTRFRLFLAMRSKAVSPDNFSNGTSPVQLVTSKAALKQLNMSMIVAGFFT